MQEHPRVARGQNDRQEASGGLDRLVTEERAFGGVASNRFRRPRSAGEDFEAGPGGPCLEPLLAVAVAYGDGAHHEPYHRLGVTDEAAVARGHRDPLDLLAQPPLYGCDRRREATRGGIGTAQEGLGGGSRLVERERGNRVVVGDVQVSHSRDRRGRQPTAHRDLTRRPGGGQESITIE